MTHKTLMHFADNFASLHRFTSHNETDKARAALSAAIAELIAERDSLREQVRREQLYVHDLAKDAARYRWLRDKSFSDIWLEYSGCYPRHGLDAAIDLEMKGTPT